MAFEWICAFDWAGLWMALATLAFAASSFVTLHYQRLATIYSRNFARWQEQLGRLSSARGKPFSLTIKFGPKVCQQYLEPFIPGKSEGSAGIRPDEQVLMIFDGPGGMITAPTDRRHRVSAWRRPRIWQPTLFMLPPEADYANRTLSKVDLRAVAGALQANWEAELGNRLKEGDEGELESDLVRHLALLFTGWRVCAKWRQWTYLSIGIAFVTSALAIMTYIHRGLPFAGGLASC